MKPNKLDERRKRLMSIFKDADPNDIEHEIALEDMENSKHLESWMH